MPIDIAGLAVTTRPMVPARRGGGDVPVRIKKLPDGRLMASASFRGALVQVVLPPQLGRRVNVGSAYSVGAEALIGSSFDVGAEAIIGSIWTSIAKGFAAIHKSKIVQGVAAGALSLYGVPPGVTRKALDMTGDLINKAADSGVKGKKAKKRIQQIGAMARAGNPVAAKAAAVIKVRNRAERRVRAAMDLLSRAQGGNARARQAVQSIEARAARGDTLAAEATRVMQTVVDAATGRLRPGQAAAPPPSARGGRRDARALPPSPPRGALPPPRTALARRPAPGDSRVLTLKNARVVRQGRSADGKRQVLIQVGGAGLDWLKQQLGYHRGYRGEAEVQTIRELYNAGLAASR